MSDPGGTVVLECSVAPGFSMSSFTMLWYRQNHYRAPIEFLIKEHEQTAGHFKASIEASKNKFSLQITELSVNDSSTYYCAARHSAEHRPDSHTNTKPVCHRWHADRKELWFI
uniref:Ig lambda chain V-VI region SUT n=1 Tax=Larimichthys crocea TaxID=215358 RepID=A0A0F8AV96_LARCR